ncbi:MAG: tRNA (adenosine(37)-N6)-threonylcarbamoyltransferase complex ATPase subunit type 1 TsaE [Thermosynechococcaceae cyanobacterium]
MTDLAPFILSLSDLEQTQRVGQKLGQILNPGSILMLSGDLGSGKTTLVQGIGAGLGITDAIASPTFALIHEYPEGRIPLYHLDLYRLSPEEVQDLHLETYWDATEVAPGIVAIEWPDRLTVWPEPYLHLMLSYAEVGRQMSIVASGPGDWPALEPLLR